ncbi:unnamed protein product [Sphagnum troendelagicum]|uniref:Uncharacterized protein n=1 Tax=Sphagnum troendelagicum TaxID=128251 RepID=A0ABP0TFR4_9BRYO
MLRAPRRRFLPWNLIILVAGSSEFVVGFGSCVWDWRGKRRRSNAVEGWRQFLVPGIGAANNIASDGLGLRPISSVAKEGGKKYEGAAAAAEEVVEAAGREQCQGGDDDTGVSASVSDKGGASCHAQQTQQLQEKEVTEIQPQG